MKLQKLLFQALVFLAIPVPSHPLILPINNTQDKNDSIKIGLLIPENKSIEARQGAEIAVRKANEKGGINGRQFQLIVRSMEGPWGTGSKEAVNLIFEDKVVAIVGSSDGRNAHLIEQVSTKARIVFLSVWASDPTLSQAFVPWYFSCVPNDQQQSATLIYEIFNRKKLLKVAAVSDNSYDANMAIKSFVREIKTTGKGEPAQFIYDTTNQDPVDLLDSINSSGADCIVLFGQPDSAFRIIHQIQLKRMKQHVFGILAVLGENETSYLQKIKSENISFISSGYPVTSPGSAFLEEYKKTYGSIPGEIAAYSYDGMCLIIEAIRNAGADRDNIQKILANIHFEGVTGVIEFDKKGNRKGIPEINEMKNEVLTPPGK